MGNANDINNGDMNLGGRISTHKVNDYERDEFEEDTSLKNDQDDMNEDTAVNEGNAIAEKEENDLLEADFEDEDYDDHELNDEYEEEADEEIDKEEVDKENNANGEAKYEKIMSREETLPTDSENVREE